MTNKKNTYPKVRNPQVFYGECYKLIQLILTTKKSTEDIFKQYFRANPQMGKNDRQLMVDWVNFIFRNFTDFSDKFYQTANVFIQELEKLADLDENSNINKKKLANNLPDWLFLQLQKLFPENANEIANSYKQRAPIDLRINSWKLNDNVSRQSLLDSLQEYIGDSWQSNNLDNDLGLRLSPNNPVNSKSVNLQNNEDFTNGVFEVQDYGSQLIINALPKKLVGNLFVDYCAGGGGKTMALLSHFYAHQPKKFDSKIVLACDINDQKLQNLTARVKRAEFPNADILQTIRLPNIKLMQKYQGRADLVLVDAPCSGLGTLRRAPEIAWRLTQDQIVFYGEQQKTILTKAARLVRSGGLLLYATCSWHPQENYQIISDFINSQTNFEWGELDVSDEVFAAQNHNLKAVADITSDIPAKASLFINPLSHGSDGFFMAMVRRK